MNILPAIDLINSQCVRLKKGDFNQLTTYPLSPFEVAREYQTNGAKFLHVVDLDGAKKGAFEQFEVIQIIRDACDMTLQVGGGINSKEIIDRLFAMGVDRVVIGSLAVRDKHLTSELLQYYGSDRITLALDVHIQNSLPMIATHGWVNTSDQTLDDLIEYYAPQGLKHVLCTDISKDGLLKGPNIKLYQAYQRCYPDIVFQASGGVGKLNDLTSLKQAGVKSVIVGKALYENKFTLKEALTC